MGLCSRLLVFSVFLFLLLSISSARVGAVDEDAVVFGLADAEKALASAYDAVLEAEEAGANVSGLLVGLNVGGEYLAEAYVWYRLGAYENASRFAGLCREAVGNVISEAVSLRAEAESVGETDFTVKMYSSAIGVAVVLTLGFVVWRVFKRRYDRRLLGLKPEVVSDEP